MAAPSSYTESTLAEYMHTVLGDVATQLGWTAADSYDNAVDEALLAYGCASIADVSGAQNIALLRAYARAEVWNQVAAYTTADIDFSADGASYSRSQLHSHARTQAALASADVQQRGGYGYTVRNTHIDHAHDPYQYRPDDERVRFP
jgi:hypothetical protein